MKVDKVFNSFLGRRSIVMDVKTTGETVENDGRIIEISAIELVGGRTTGREFYCLLNPEKELSAEVAKRHNLQADALKEKPSFPFVAEALRSFIGKDAVVIASKLVNGMGEEIRLVNDSLLKAGFPAVAAEQWVNTRPWAEALYGEKGAALEKLIDRFKIMREINDNPKKNSLYDARMLSKVYPRLLTEYSRVYNAREEAVPTHITAKPQDASPSV